MTDPLSPKSEFIESPILSILIYLFHEKTKFEKIDDTSRNKYDSYGSLEICTDKCPTAVKFLPPETIFPNLKTKCPISEQECLPIVECADHIPDTEIEKRICTQDDGSPGLCCENIDENVGSSVPIISQDLVGVRTHSEVYVFSKISEFLLDNEPN